MVEETHGSLKNSGHLLFLNDAGSGLTAYVSYPVKFFFSFLCRVPGMLCLMDFFLAGNEPATNQSS